MNEDKITVLVIQAQWKKLVVKQQFMKSDQKCNEF